MGAKEKGPSGRTIQEKRPEQQPSVEQAEEIFLSPAPAPAPSLASVGFDPTRDVLTEEVKALYTPKKKGQDFFEAKKIKDFLTDGHRSLSEKAQFVGYVFGQARVSRASKQFAKLLAQSFNENCNIDEDYVKAKEYCENCLPKLPSKGQRQPVNAWWIDAKNALNA